MSRILEFVPSQEPPTDLSDRSIYGSYNQQYHRIKTNIDNATIEILLKTIDCFYTYCEPVNKDVGFRIAQSFKTLEELRNFCLELCKEGINRDFIYSSTTRKRGSIGNLLESTSCGD